jgi:transposase, IS5 family
MEQLLQTTIETAVAMNAVKASEFERVIVGTNLQETAVADPTDSQLLAVARCKIAGLTKDAGIEVKHTYEYEGQALRRKADGYSHARQFKAAQSRDQAATNDPRLAHARCAAQDDRTRLA